MELHKSLPTGWEWKKLIEIAEDNKNAIVDGPFGSNLKVSDYIKSTEGVPVLTTKNLDGVYDNENLRYISHEKFKELRRSEVRGGDILVAKIGSCGKTGIYPKNMPSAIIPANLLKISVKDSVNKMYVYYYLNSNGFRNKLSEITTATAQPAFAVTKFRKLPIPLPNRQAQDDIVEKIEELFSQLDEGVAGLKRAQAALKHYRGSVLKAAFEGRLVPQDPNDEPANVLLRMIGKKPKIEDNPEEELPKSWEWATLNDISTIILGQSPPSSTYNFERVGLPFFQGKAEFGKIYPTADRWCSKPKKIADKDDVLISVRAPVGPTNLASEKCCIGRGLAAIRAKKIILSKYIFYYFRSIENDWGRKSTGTTFKAITGNILKNSIIPLAPIEEQSRIVNKIETNLSLIDKLTITLDTEVERSSSLRNSILKSAFSGNLISYDPPIDNL